MVRRTPISNYIQYMPIGNQFSANVLNECQDATMPYDARVFAQAAVDKNPTEGNVFDVSLIFEQIAVDFENLLDNVKSVIFDVGQGLGFNKKY